MKQGKYVSAKEVTEKTAENMKKGDYTEIEKSLLEGCIFYNNGIRKYNIKDCLEGLEQYDTYKIEQRGNSVKNEETYRIYWNGWNIDKASQIITLYLKKEIKQDEVGYEIYQIVFENNNV